MRRLALIAALAIATSLQAQTYAQMKLWDSHQRHPQINQIEFAGDEEQLATYDAIYGHGPMIENDYYALRVYADLRQSIDLYGKQTSAPVLAKTDFYATNEQRDQGLGQDILFVGPSIGAGSLRAIVDGQLTNFATVGARGARVVCSTPDSAIVESYVRGWQVGGRTLDVTQRYTMRAHQRETQIDVYIEGDTDGLQLCTGVQKLESDNNGWVLPGRGVVASWGSNVPEKTDPQTVHALGIAVKVDKPYKAGTAEDELNYLVRLTPRNGHIRYSLYVAADMEQGGGYHTPDAWLAYVKGL